MKKTLAAVALLLGIHSPAAIDARTIPWAGTLRIEIATPSGLAPPMTAEGTSLATVNGSGGGDHLTTLRLDGGITTDYIIVPITDPVVGMTVTSFRATAIRLGAGTFSPISGGGSLASGVLPVQGTSSTAC